MNSLKPSRSNIFWHRKDRAKERKREHLRSDPILRKCPILFLSKENRLSSGSEVSWPIARFSSFFFLCNFCQPVVRAQSRESKSTSDRPRFVARCDVKFMVAVRAHGFMRIQCLNWKIIGQCLDTEHSVRCSLFSKYNQIFPLFDKVHLVIFH